MQNSYIIPISILSALFTFGFVWLSWDLAYKISEAHYQRKMRAHADALLNDTNKPDEEDRPE